MPGIICVSLADADFGDFSWELLLGLMLGKLFLFALTWGVCSLLGHGAGVAATVALFCVQSNDLPVGNPLMSALYRDYRPHMMKYLFLMPASTLLFFVPVANAAIQMDKSQRREKCALANGDGRKTPSPYRLLTRQNWLLIYSSLKSPVTLSTVLGIALNTLFKSQVPGILHQPINVVAATIPGIALSILGFSFVRKERYLFSSAVVPATLLLVIKMVLTPLVLHTTVRLLTSGTRLLSDFALLYGIISPATAVFHAGQEFRKPLAAMSVALIVTSFTCFPASYIVARFTLVPAQNRSYYIPTLQKVLFWIAAGSAVCDVLVWISVLRKRKWCAVPHSYVTCLVFTQFLTSCGVLWGNLPGSGSWTLYCQMALYFGGEVSGCAWLATVPVVLVLAERRPASSANGYSILFFIAFSLSALITAVMCALVSFSDVRRVYFIGPTTSGFEFWQMAATTGWLSLCWGTAAVCLVLHFKKLPMTDGDVAPGKREKSLRCYENATFCVDAPEEDDKQSGICMKSVFGAKEEADFYYEDILRWGGSGRNSYEEKEWSFRIFSLILIVWLTTAVKLVSNLFKLARSDAVEIMVSLEFLQSSLFVGQGFFLLLTFGVDVRTMAISSVKWCRKIRHGKKEYFPGSEATEADVVVACRLFYQFYWGPCFRDLAKERRWKENVYKDCFWGHQLVDWLIREELCKDDTEAEEYGQKLLLGGVIGHVRDAHLFYDAPYLYHFIGRKSKSFTI